MNEPPIVPQQPSEVTLLLQRWSAGDQECFEELLRLVDTELRLIAHRHMRNEPEGHTLQTTALLNEAYLKLIDQSRMSWQQRSQFFGVAAGLMRRILVDHARALQRVKRGGAAVHLPFQEELFQAPDRSSLVALDDALAQLSKQFPRQAKVVEMRYFGGMSVEESSAVLGTHPNTVIRDWVFAKAWLKRELSK